MKTKHAIIILVLGFCLDFLGSLFKITHRPGAVNILTLAAIMKILGTLLLLYKIITYHKIKEFLNS